jgi:hypothetical protein
MNPSETIIYEYELYTLHVWRDIKMLNPEKYRTIANLYEIIDLFSDSNNSEIIAAKLIQKAIDVLDGREDVIFTDREQCEQYGGL